MPKMHEQSPETTFVPADFGIGRLFLVVNDGVVVANAKTERIVLWNVAAERIFGYSESEALQLPLHALVPEHLRDRHREGIARYQENGHGDLIDAGHPVELTGLHKEGREVAIELTLTAIPETHGEARFALAIIRDVSDRKRAEEAAARERDAKSRRRQALELNDEIVQGLAVAKMALETGQPDQGLRAVTHTLQRAQSIVSQLLEDISGGAGFKPGDLVRDKPAGFDESEIQDSGVAEPS